MSEALNSPEAKSRRFRPYPKYKASGVEWLGEIPAHWEAERLKLVSFINMGQSPSSEIVNTSGEGLPFLQGNADFGTEHPTAQTFCPAPPKIAEFGDVLLSVRAPVGALNVADQKYGIGRGLCAIRPNSQILERTFCHYVLQIARHQLNELAKGSTYDAVSSSEVSCLIIPLPSIKEQRAIASFLDHETAKIDALIEKKERLIELLQEKRTALITQAVTKGLDPTVPMKDSGVDWLGNIPAHWEAKRLKLASFINMGQSPSSDIVNTSGEGLPFLQGNADFGTEHPTAQTFCPAPLKIAEFGNVLMSVRAPVGALNLADQKYGIGRGLCAIRPNIQILERTFCHYVLQIARHELDGLAKGSTYDAVSSSEVSCLLIPLPSIKEQRTLASFLDRETANIDALVAKIQEAIDRLKEYRTALISAAVTGKIDVQAENY
jgi:type I restriction enzyme S subunit